MCICQLKRLLVRAKSFSFCVKCARDWRKRCARSEGETWTATLSFASRSDLSHKSKHLWGNVYCRELILTDTLERTASRPWSSATATQFRYCSTQFWRTHNKVSSRQVLRYPPVLTSKDWHVSRRVRTVVNCAARRCCKAGPKNAQSVYQDDSEYNTFRLVGWYPTI